MYEALTSPFLISEGGKVLQSAIAYELEGEGLEENDDFKFDKGVLFARDESTGRSIADALIGYAVTISDKPRKGDGWYKVDVSK